MNTTSHTPEIEKQDLRELEFEIGPNPDDDAVAIEYQIAFGPSSFIFFQAQSSWLPGGLFMKTC